MPEEREQLPLDARLLSEAVIELNISRRNVAIYPRGHPSVERSLQRVFDHFKKLFDLRTEITLAIAKDTLIVDNFFLDKKNPVYREFALHLSGMGIAYVTFLSGLAPEELYEFHRFISGPQERPPEEFPELLREHRVTHIRIGLVDYGAFSFQEGKTESGEAGTHLWERYIHALLEGSLLTEDNTDGIPEIPPQALAMFLNQHAGTDLKEETYDHVITSYMRKSSERGFSGGDLKRLMEFINDLRPELKRQFLSSTVRTVSRDLESAERAINEMPVEDLIHMLTIMNEMRVSVPESLKNLLDKLSRLHQQGFAELNYQGNMLVDDMFLSDDIANLLTSGGFESFITDTYYKEIKKLLEFDATQVAREKLGALMHEFKEESLERDFSLVIQELIALRLVGEDDYRYFVDTLREEAEVFIGTGQYSLVLKTISLLEANSAEGFFPEITGRALEHFRSPGFMERFIDSLRIAGRQARDEALCFCDHYGDRVLPSLFDALIEEESQTVRRFFIGLISHFGDTAVAEAARRLSDPRWFVKRNMLYVISECNPEKAVSHARTYCHHENTKVAFEAVKCLLKAGDGYGLSSLRDYLREQSREIVEQAVHMCGAFRIRECIPDLLQMLRKRGISGADFYEKIPVVRALGEIGDPRALEGLREILSVKSLLFRGVLEDLKTEIYKTLRKYPYDSVRDLVEEGMKSRVDAIREEAARIRRGHGG